jgi:hypothetical protein
MLKELKNWVSDDADLDTVTRWYQWEKAQGGRQYSGSARFPE